MKRKQVLVLTILLVSTLVGIIGIFPQKVQADALSYIPISYQGKKGSYSGGSLDNLWEKDSLYFEWDVESTYIPPYFTMYEFKVEFFFDENVGPVNEILIELSFHQQVTIVVRYEDESSDGGTTWQGSWSATPNGKEITKIIASCVYFYPANPTCKFNQILVTPLRLQSPEEGQSYGAGHFKSSYGFDCDVSGNPPTGWTTETQGGTVKVIDEVSGYDAHKKVVEFHDTNENNDVEMSQPLPDDYYGGQNGVIDFYVKASETKPFYIVIQDGSESNSIYLYFDADSMIKYKASSVHNIMPYHEGKWYHFQIFYDCYIGTHWALFINGIGQGQFNFRGDPELLDSIRFFTSSSYSDYKYYIDAIGYEWDPGYGHGDNEVAGLPLKFRLHDSDSYYYYIDGEYQDILSSPTLSGIFYIPLLDNGEHTIQVIGSVSGADSGEISFFMEINEILDWGTDLINAEVVWGGVEDAVDVDPTYGTPSGQGINVLVIDSGIDWTHDELWTNIQGFDYDYVDIDDNPWDENGHGTHCAGIIAAEDNDRGMIGVAPNANIYVARILDEDGEGDFVYAGYAIQWAIDTHDDANPSNDIDIISMSFRGPQGGDQFSSWVEEKCINATNEGIICIAASGNYDSRNYPTFNISEPASFDSVISVGSVGQSGDDVERAYTSCYIGDLDLVAPGVNITSSACEPLDGEYWVDEYQVVHWVDKDQEVNGYATISGTSMACPMVSGVVALILSASQAIYDLTGTDRVDAIKECLFETADNSIIIDYTSNECGHGVVMADDAVNYAIDPQRPWN